MLIDESFVDVPTSVGTTMRIFTFHPKIPNYPQVKFPGVVLYSEIYQGPVTRIAKQIAGQGFIVACPSIYHNFVGPEPLAYDDVGTDAGNDYKIQKPLDSYDEDAKLAIEYLLKLPTCNGKLGTSGICIGGHLAFRTAFHPAIRAAVCFFPTDIHKHSLGLGMKDDSLDRCGEIKGEITMIFGTKDPHVPAEGRDIIRQTMREKNVEFTFLEIHGAQHAFVRDENSKGRYDPAVTKLCMDWLLELFNRKLKLDYGDHDGQVEEIKNVC